MFNPLWKPQQFCARSKLRGIFRLKTVIYVPVYYSAMAYALPLHLANGELMNKEQVDSFARLLRAQRNHLLEEFRRAELGLEAIAHAR